jgi:hypothetical protein
MDKLFVIVSLQALKDTSFIHSASETASVDFEADFGDLTGYMHLQFFPPLRQVISTTSSIGFREFLFDIRIFPRLIVHNDDVIRTRNTDNFSLDVFKKMIEAYEQGMQ